MGSTVEASRPGGQVVAFSGHMLDAPGRPSARFPPAREDAVAGAIAAELERIDARVGVTSLACGADILFVEAMLARRGEVHAVLPLNVEEFLEESVRTCGDERWESRFHAARERLASEEIVGDDYLRGSGTPFQLAALLIDGAAQMIARDRGGGGGGGEAAALAVWDGLPGDGFGGTASFVGHCVSQRRKVRCIHPMTGIVSEPGAEAIEIAQKHSWRRVPAGAATLEHRLAAFLFADARGFSQLRETQIPAFARLVLGVLRGAIGDVEPRPAVVNTWGDGLFVVTLLPRTAAEFSLRLQERAAKLNWSAEGLPSRIVFRIGLHAGPAFLVEEDPIVGRANAYGRDVSRAARIEPMVTPGEVWASRTFVVLSAATGCQGLAFDDLGQKVLAKDAGEVQLYRVRREAAR